MMTQSEIKDHVPPYDSKAWLRSKRKIARQVLKNEEAAKKRSEARKKAKKLE